MKVHGLNLYILNCKENCYTPFVELNQISLYIYYKLELWEIKHKGCKRGYKSEGNFNPDTEELKYTRVYYAA